MIQINLENVPSQGIITNVLNQSCVIRLRTIGDNLYFSLSTDELGIICQNVLCVDRSPLVRAKYTGFIGDFIFLDTQGEEKPTYDKLNSRFFLIYDENEFKELLK